jgi:preprotein translocase subunit YajC
VKIGPYVKYILAFVLGIASYFLYSQLQMGYIFGSVLTTLLVLISITAFGVIGYYIVNMPSPKKVSEYLTYVLSFFGTAVLLSAGIHALFSAVSTADLVYMAVFFSVILRLLKLADENKKLKLKKEVAEAVKKMYNGIETFLYCSIVLLPLFFIVTYSSSSIILDASIDFVWLVPIVIVAAYAESKVSMMLNKKGRKK